MAICAQFMLSGVTGGLYSAVFSVLSSVHCAAQCSTAVESNESNENDLLRRRAPICPRSIDFRHGIVRAYRHGHSGFECRTREVFITFRPAY